MKISEKIKERLDDAQEQKDGAGLSEISYYAGLEHGLSSAYDVARIEELKVIK